MKIINNGGKRENCPNLWDSKAAEKIVEIIANIKTEISKW